MSITTSHLGESEKQQFVNRSSKLPSGSSGVRGRCRGAAVVLTIDNDDTTVSSALANFVRAGREGVGRYEDHGANVRFRAAINVMTRVYIYYIVVKVRVNMNYTAGM